MEGVRFWSGFAYPNAFRTSFCPACCGSVVAYAYHGEACVFDPKHLNNESVLWQHILEPRFEHCSHTHVGDFWCHDIIKCFKATGIIHHFLQRGQHMMHTYRKRSYSFMYVDSNYAICTAHLYQQTMCLPTKRQNQSSWKILVRQSYISHQCHRVVCAWICIQVCLNLGNLKWLTKGQTTLHLLRVACQWQLQPNQWEKWKKNLLQQPRWEQNRLWKVKDWLISALCWTRCSWCFVKFAWIAWKRLEDDMEAWTNFISSVISGNTRQCVLLQA